MAKDDTETYTLSRKNLRQEWPVLLVLVGMLVAAFFLYPQLPERVPVHWNYKGEVDGYGSRLEAAFEIPLLTLGLYLLLLVIPLVDPNRHNYARFYVAYRVIRWSFVFLMAVVYGIIMFSALGYTVDVGLWVNLVLSLIFVVTGNVMGQIRPNYFVGIRTPWTLASEEVWRRTHRLTARVWVFGGLICLLLSFVPGRAGAIAFVVVGIVSMGLIPIVASYVYYSLLEKDGG